MQQSVALSSKNERICYMQISDRLLTLRKTLGYTQENFQNFLVLVELITHNMRVVGLMLILICYNLLQNSLILTCIG